MIYSEYKFRGWFQTRDSDEYLRRLQRRNLSEEVDFEFRIGIQRRIQARTSEEAFEKNSEEEFIERIQRRIQDDSAEASATSVI